MVCFVFSKSFKGLTRHDILPTIIGFPICLPAEKSAFIFNCLKVYESLVIAGTIMYVGQPLFSVTLSDGQVYET